jgi:hypothetical protein
VSGICPDSAVQTNFIDYDSEKYEKRRRLDEVIDRIIRNRPRFFFINDTTRSKIEVRRYEENLITPNYSSGF